MKCCIDVKGITVRSSYTIVLESRSSQATNSEYVTVSRALSKAYVLIIKVLWIDRRREGSQGWARNGCAQIFLNSMDHDGSPSWVLAN